MAYKTFQKNIKVTTLISCEALKYSLSSHQLPGILSAHVSLLVLHLLSLPDLLLQLVAVLLLEALVSSVPGNMSIKTTLNINSLN